MASSIVHNRVSSLAAFDPLFFLLNESRKRLLVRLPLLHHFGDQHHGPVPQHHSDEGYNVRVAKPSVELRGKTLTILARLGAKFGSERQSIDDIERESVIVAKDIEASWIVEVGFGELLDEDRTEIEQNGRVLSNRNCRKRLLERLTSISRVVHLESI